MAMSQNKAVQAAYESGEYTDAKGNNWVKGMDGWFLNMGEAGLCLAYHHDFVEMIEKENPDG